MKEIIPTPKKLLLISSILIIVIISGVFMYKYIHDKKIYDSISLSLVGNSDLEYGDSVNSLDLVEKLSYGEISSYPEKIDTLNVGAQKLTYKVTEENVSREFSFVVEVKDTKKPKIELKNPSVFLKIGDNYNLESNILSVKDEIDGDLLFSKDKELNGYYTINSNLNTKRIGIYKASVIAVDKNNNKEIMEYNIVVENKAYVKLRNNVVTVYIGEKYNLSNNIIEIRDSMNNKLTTTNTNGYYKVSSSYNYNKVGNYNVNIDVIDKYENKKTFTYQIKVINRPAPVVYSTSKSAIDTNQLISVAKKYLKYKYRFGANNPSTGFDCSGYVQYVFSQFSRNTGRSTSEIARAGVRVTKNSMMPGDILIWSDRRDGYPTHVGIYIGNNTMIHAANEYLNVEIRSLDSWNGRIVDVRRMI